MRLSQRLEAVLKTVSAEAPVGRLVDVGTDHAFIPVEAVARGLASRAVASDVRSGPLERAAEHIAAAGLTDRVSLVLADGIPEEELCADDVIVITGMGGPLICRILVRGAALLPDGIRLVLSPQSHADEFRSFLADNGFEVTSEACVAEDGKYYFICGALCRTGTAIERPLPHELVYGRLALFDEASRAARLELIKKDLAVYGELLLHISPESENRLRRRQELARLVSLAERAAEEYNSL